MAWQAFADPPHTATVAVDASHVKSGASSLRFVTDSGSDCGIRYVVPGGAGAGTSWGDGKSLSAALAGVAFHLSWIVIAIWTLRIEKRQRRPDKLISIA